MLGSSLVVQSYVVINQGCPLAITTEGTDHALIRCGGGPGESFELVVQHEALRALVELGTDALRRLDGTDEQAGESLRR
jgi:hypothetical protein